MAISKSKRKRAPHQGTSVVWPAGLEQMLGLTPITRWRWEKAGKLPPRDKNIGGKTGWSHAVLNAAGIDTQAGASA